MGVPAEGSASHETSGGVPQIGYPRCHVLARAANSPIRSAMLQLAVNQLQGIALYQDLAIAIGALR